MKEQEKTELDAELEKRGLTLKQLEDAADWVVSVIKQVVAVIKDVCRKVFDAVLCATTDNPKYWHYYKHAKKHRTRKKYRSKLIREAVANVKKGAFI